MSRCYSRPKRASYIEYEIHCSDCGSPVDTFLQLADALLEYETLDLQEVKRILAGETIRGGADPASVE